MLDNSYITSGNVSEAVEKILEITKVITNAPFVLYFT